MTNGRHDGGPWYDGARRAVTGGTLLHYIISCRYFFLKGRKALGYGKNTAVAFFDCFQYWTSRPTCLNCPIHIQNLGRGLGGGCAHLKNSNI